MSARPLRIIVPHEWLSTFIRCRTALIYVRRSKRIGIPRKPALKTLIPLLSRESRCNRIFQNPCCSTINAIGAEGHFIELFTETVYRNSMFDMYIYFAVFFEPHLWSTGTPISGRSRRHIGRVGICYELYRRLETQADHATHGTSRKLRQAPSNPLMQNAPFRHNDLPA